MRMLIVVGDRHSGGGSVITGSPHTDIDGLPVARVGDKATCPTHKGIFPIITGDSTLIIDGNAVARHGDKLACGCSLFSGKQSRASITAQGPGPRPSTISNVVVAANSLAPPLAPLGTSEVCKECLLAASKKSAVFLSL